jgi:ATP-dependent DNA helicase RecG
MNTTPSLEQLECWMRGEEDEHLEFKEAKTQVDGETLTDYCVALANEGGGVLVLGVTNKKPRCVVGSQAIGTPAKTKHYIYTVLMMRVEIDVLQHPDGRVVVIGIPSRPVGTPLQHRGRYLMRSGESLVPMTPDRLKVIFAEEHVDFSAEECAGASDVELDENAIERFRSVWARKSGNRLLLDRPVDQLLSDAGLVRSGRVTYAGLILLGTAVAIKRFLPQSEIVFEWRDSENRVEYQDRREFREAFFLVEDRLWETISLRNTIQQFQDGLFRRDIPTFNEAAAREAILNAVCHRDYQAHGSTFVRQFPNALSITSPGGFPAGVTVENILFKQSPRNRLIAETLARVGLVERSGQGVDVMFKSSIEEGKRPPDFSNTDDFHVEVTLRGSVDDPQFLRFLEKVGAETGREFSVLDLVVLDRINREDDVPADLRPRLKLLEASGVIEHVGAGRGTRYFLSKRFYDFLGRGSVYTRRRGLDRETNKELLLRHIERDLKKGSTRGELRGVLPGLTPNRSRSFCRS